MARLTKEEIQDIRRYLDADKPLPDKFRFLLFDDKREVELIWRKKTNEVCNVVLPFQTIEQVDEPRIGAGEKSSREFKVEDVMETVFDPRGRQAGGWSNKLIWGDNKLILSSLKNGPMRKAIEEQGGLKLIYIDPPFDVGYDFSMDIEVGDDGDKLTKDPNILEEIAYRDTWGKGQDSFIAMIYERLALMRDLLAEDGSIYVHCDWRVTSLIRLVMDEIFGKNNFLNEVVWSYKSGGATKERYGRKHDTIWFYSANKKYTFNVPKEKSYNRELKPYRFKGIEEYKDEVGWYTLVNARDVWPIDMVGRTSAERIDYPTQKPEALLERIIKASSNEGDLIADFFCGSGTTAAVAEKLGRKWIATDLGKFSIHTTRKRMIGIQRQLKKEDKEYRAFEVLNLGKYERQHYIGVNPDLREEEKQQQIAAKETEFLDLILHAYQAESVTGFETFHGKKSGRMVVVGPINLPVSRLFVEEIILSARKKHISKVDILGFEFEMGMFPNLLNEAREKGVDIAPKQIPTEVFDTRAVERNQVVFHDVAYIEARLEIKNDKVAVELTDFSVSYQQKSISQVESTIGKNKNKIVVEKGQVVKVSKDKNGICEREVLTKKWSDWIDYWSVDFDFESKKEIIRVKDSATDKWVTHKTGAYIFENEWQSFRTRGDRSLELKSAYHPVKSGSSKVAVKVVDIFGNDTMTLLDLAG